MTEKLILIRDWRDGETFTVKQAVNEELTDHEFYSGRSIDGELDKIKTMMGNLVELLVDTGRITKEELLTKILPHFKEQTEG